MAEIGGHLVGGSIYEQRQWNRDVETGSQIATKHRVLRAFRPANGRFDGPRITAAILVG
jgi:hypothetical protein